MWIHEAEVPHPLFIDEPSSIEDFMVEMPNRWQSFVRGINSSPQVKVVEACFFNNEIEYLLTHDRQRSEIFAYALNLQEIIAPLEPVLVYLVQDDVRSALVRNFNNRGKGFEEFVVQYATGTPIARQRGWMGFEGMIQFWETFVSLTDEIFQMYRIRKLAVNTASSSWDDCNHQVMDFLGLHLVPEPRIPPQEARELTGVYKDASRDKEFLVNEDHGELTINLLSSARCRLIPQANGIFIAEGWHFEVCFERSPNSGKVNRIRFGGRDVDYLALVGKTADRIINSYEESG